MRQARVKALISIVIISVLIFSAAGYVYAKYIDSDTSTPVSIISGSFFFDASTMTDGETQKNVTVSDGSAVSERFELCNYKDPENFTKIDISYTASISCNNLFSDFLVSVDDIALDSGGVYVLHGGLLSADAFVIEIQSGYENGTVLQLTVEAQSPYKKTLIYRFNLFDMPGGDDGDLSYQMDDSPGRVNTRLRLNSLADMYVTLDWRATFDAENDRYNFLIDMTSANILTDVDTDGNGMNDIEEGFTVVFVPVGQVIEIDFFKRNANEKFKAVSAAAGETLFINQTLGAGWSEDKTYHQDNPFGHLTSWDTGKHYGEAGREFDLDAVLDGYEDFPEISKDDALTVQFISGYVGRDFHNLEWYISSTDGYLPAYFPIGTKITFIDLTKGEAAFYYYNVKQRYISDINLMDFISMGRITNGQWDAFAGYFGAEDILFNTLENFIFLFDFSSAANLSDIVDEYGTSVITLKHSHGSGGVTNDVYYGQPPVFMFIINDVSSYSHPAGNIVPGMLGALYVHMSRYKKTLI